MSYSSITIGEICKYTTSGGTPKSNVQNYYNPPSIPWLKTKEVNYSRIYATESYISEDGLKNSSAKLIPENSVIVAMYGQGDTAGRVAINKIPVTTNQACCNLIIDDKKADYEYVYYALTSMYDKLVSLKNGGAQPNLNAALIRGVEIPYPEIKQQKKIADILSAYDNLIENNQKQIKLLEEAAQRLYKEWFIDLRFPGHETTKIQNDLPEGWTKVLISEVCDTIGGGTPSTKVSDYYDNGNIPWVTPTDITRNNGWILLDTEKKITQKGLENSSAKMLPAETILMTSRASIGYFGMYDFPVSTNQGFISCVPYKKEFKYYLLFNLMNRVDEIKQKATGSTFLEIGKTTFRNFEIIYPTKGLLVEFDGMIDSIIKRMRIIKKEIADLAQARDRLLPKLMSGEIEV